MTSPSAGIQNTNNINTVISMVPLCYPENAGLVYGIFRRVNRPSNDMIQNSRLTLKVVHSGDWSERCGVSFLLDGSTYHACFVLFFLQRLIKNVDDFDTNT